ncbi:MAG: hypothetical protein JXB39_00545 [Deltaproteobacteria bacterium]|nr:hypothetical protein [Deltaproteobacteria bacterium]
MGGTTETSDNGRIVAARALDVVRRTVTYACKNERAARAIRCLDATCLPWIDRVEHGLEEDEEKAILARLRTTLAGWSDTLDLGSRSALFADAAADLESLGVRIGPIGEPEPLEPLARLVPPPPKPARPPPPAGAGPPPEDLPPASPPEPTPEELEAEFQALLAAARRPEVEEERLPPPEPRRPLLLGDPMGTGQDLSSALDASASTAAALAEAGLETVADLLLHPPVRLDLLPRAIVPSEPLEEGTPVVVRGTVRRRRTRLRPEGSIFEVVLTDGEADVTCRWAGRVDESFRQRFHPGAKVAVLGSPERDGERAVLLEGEVVSVDSRGQGRQAVYGIPGVPDPETRRLQRLALDRFRDRILDPVPEELRRNLKLLELNEAIERLHFPGHGYRRGRERLAFDELLLYQLGVGMLRRRAPQERGIAHPVSHRLVSQILLERGRSLTDAQEVAFSEIRRDLGSPRPMNRLLQGEVGTGKGLLTLLAAVVVAEARSQVFFLAPDILAAEHRFLFAEPLLRAVGLVPALVAEKPDAGQADAIRRGEIHVVFGTRALARSWPACRRLGLVVVEEHGTYGTVSLQDLPLQGHRPDLLVVSDAPLPTSLALTVFGGMDISLVPGTLPANQDLQVFPPEKRLSAYALAREEVEAGRQAYVVLPLVRGQEPLTRSDLARFADALRNEAFPGARIGIFSGLMNREERQRAYDDFSHRRVDVLMTTTVIEDGPPVPSATAMVVEQADRFDLVRLHRLRAHVAHGVRPGRCLFVLGPAPDPVGVASVDLVLKERDGFRIAELDLTQRGTEGLLGERAAEAPAFRWVDGLEHRELLVRSRAEAFALLSQRPLLQSPEHEPLRRSLDQAWQRWFPGRSLATAGQTGGEGSSGRRGRRRRRPNRSGGGEEG